jgi:hypothetical protein
MSDLRMSWMTDKILFHISDAPRALGAGASYLIRPPPALVLCVRSDGAEVRGIAKPA